MSTPKSIFEFWKDSATRDNVHEYLIQYLRDEAIRKVFEGENVEAVAEAKEMIDKAFENMDLLFQAKPKSKKNINEAR